MAENYPGQGFGPMSTIPAERLEDGLISRFTGAKLQPDQVAMQKAYASLPHMVKGIVKRDAMSNSGIVTGQDLWQAMQTATRPEVR